MKVEEQYERLPRTDERIEGQAYFDTTGEPSIKVKRKIVELCKENNINVEDK